MKSLWALIKINFKSLLLTTTGFGRKGGKKKQARTGIGAFVFLSLLMLYLSGVYSFILGSAMAPYGALPIMLISMLIMSCVWPLVFILFGAQSMVFSTKDIDLVLSLPVSSFSIMLSRVMAMYLQTLFMLEMMLIPVGVSWLVYGGGGGVLFFVRLLLSGVFLALLPTTVSLVFGCLVSLMVAKLPFKNFFNVIFSALLLVGTMFAVMRLTMSADIAESGALDVAGLTATLSSAFPPAAWAAQGIMGSMGYFLLTMAVCVLPFLAITWFFSLFFKRLLTLLSSHKLKSNYKIGRMKSTGAFSALLKKESRKFFGTPAFLLNSGMGLILAIVASVIALVNKNAIIAFMGQLSGMGAGDVFTHLAPLVTAVCMVFAGMTFISCVSISLEGKTLWILKESPLSVGQIFAAKAGFNFIIEAGVVLVCLVLLSITFSLPPFQAVLMIIAALLFSLLNSTSGLFINLLLPRMDAENETMVIKQSASTLVSMLFSFVMIAALVFAYIGLASLGLGFAAIAGVCIVLLAALCALAILLLNTKGKKLYNEL